MINIKLAIPGESATKYEERRHPDPQAQAEEHGRRRARCVAPRAGRAPWYVALEYVPRLCEGCAHAGPRALCLWLVW